MKTILLSFLAIIFISKANAQCSDIAINFRDSVVGNTVYFFDESIANNGWSIDKRYWAYGDSLVDSIVLNPIHVYAHSGAYNVCLSIMGKLPVDTVTSVYCTESVCHQVSGVSTGIVEDSRADEWLIYPNPTPGYLQIIKGSGMLQSVSIYNIVGQFITKASEANFIMLPDEPHDALYFITIKTDCGNINRLIRKTG
jgi:PKD repeat protein